MALVRCSFAVLTINCSSVMLVVQKHQRIQINGGSVITEPHTKLYSAFGDMFGNLHAQVRGNGTPPFTAALADLLPWYCPGNQHCSCDHVSLHPTRKSQVSKEGKIVRKTKHHFIIPRSRPIVSETAKGNNYCRS